MRSPRWTRVAGRILFALAILPGLVVGVRAIAFGIAPPQVTVLGMAAAYGLGAVLYTLPWLPHLKTWRATSRLRRQERGATVLAVRDIRIANAAAPWQGFIPVSPGGAVVAVHRSLVVHSDDADRPPLWRAGSPIQVQTQIARAGGSSLMAGGGAVTEIAVRAADAEVRFLLLAPSLAARFFEDDARTQEIAAKLASVVNASSEAP